MSCSSSVTPDTRSSSKVIMTGPEIQANIAETLMSGRATVEAPATLRIALTLTVLIAAIALGLSTSPWLGLLVVAGGRRLSGGLFDRGCYVEPTVITGGIINDWGSNARLGAGPWMVVEADESDGTFTKLPTQIGVVTNIDAEHLDYFKTVENMHREYETFLRNIPFYGLAVACVDDPVIRDMVERLGLRRDGRRLLYRVDSTASTKARFFSARSCSMRLTATASTPANPITHHDSSICSPGGRCSHPVRPSTPAANTAR